MTQQIDWDCHLHVTNSSIPTAYEWLLEMGGLAPAEDAEQMFFTEELQEVAEYKVIDETLHWVLEKARNETLDYEGKPCQATGLPDAPF